MLQIISTYKLPDTSEFIYHAGISSRVRNASNRLKVKSVGVQFLEQNQDILLAGLLFDACNDPMTDLSLKRYDVLQLQSEIPSFTTGDTYSLPSQTAKAMFRKSRCHDVELLCLCRSPWIEGTTSKAVYGERQKEFNVHSCIKCNNWFHAYCLKLCNIKPATKRQDFICPHCVLPQTIPWEHHKYVNTCTSDNVLTILLLHCQQFPRLIT